jgi:hypothetical protein
MGLVIIADPPHIHHMTRRAKQPDQNIDPEAISRGNNEGAALESLRQGADDLRLRDANDFKLRHRRLQLAGGVADTPVSASHNSREKHLALRTSTQAAQDSRQENLAASVFYDLWRFSCEMPDAPHLCESSSSL